MRNPNGFGTVIKMSGKRRKPWRAIKTTGYDPETGKQKRATIGYYETRKEALEGLVKYNQNPYDIDASKITFDELYKKWSTQHFKKVSEKTATQYKFVYSYLSPLLRKEFTSIKTLQLQDFFNNIQLSYASKKLIKSVLNQLYKFAIKHEIIDRDYSALLDTEKKQIVVERKIFTDEELLKLWKYKELEWVDSILIMIYSGLRVGELLTIKNCDIDLENRTIKGGIKTEAGKDRIVPINMKILPFIKKRMHPKNDTLIVGKRENELNYSNYFIVFKRVMDKLGMEHTIHDCRHTFATLMSNAEANETSIAQIIGHKSYKTTEKIYTHKDVDELKKAIDLI